MADMIKKEAPQIQEVKAFWNTEACGTHFIDEKRRTREFYEQYSRFRYKVEWHILERVPFESARGKSVLEIGCGNGADGTLFASHGARYTGVDLTPEAVEATRAHFETLGLKGTMQCENAERLSFADNSFDMVYSHGVLHHTQHPERAFNEVYRVLKPGGMAIIMLYHRHSFNYFVRIMGYMRLRTLAKIASRAFRLRSDRNALASQGMVGSRGNLGRGVWDLHYKNFLQQGWSYLKPENFVHHCTDGPECPFAFVYSASDASRLFSRFSNVTTSVSHFPLNKYGFDQPFLRPVERFLASKLGWYLFIYSTK